MKRRRVKMKTGRASWTLPVTFGRHAECYRVHTVEWLFVSVAFIEQVQAQCGQTHENTTLTAQRKNRVHLSVNLTVGEKLA